MAISSSKKPVMTLYSASLCPYAQRVRIVLEEKAMEHQVIEVNLKSKPEDLAELNPYNQVPTLVDRELVLYESNIINEYLDERFPHPPLMPVDPVSRAKARLLMLRVDRDWFRPLFDQEALSDRARQKLRDELTAISVIFGGQRFLLGEEFSLVDCALAPMLWRLPSLGIELPDSARPLQGYMERVFSRESFQRSLTPAERSLRI
ncbi:glutathione S-transferase N-terminal domain-containing protein [Thermithiobacillus plumbiphilus]|uniref:Glutathione S-transferase N-terminal domain-containing protein n=1 Tax=Thermithiobacillus plumbiphilus TaxID=1729899 RepID=A0ABU9D7V7_9PROT